MIRCVTCGEWLATDNISDAVDQHMACKHWSCSLLQICGRMNELCLYCGVTMAGENELLTHLTEVHNFRGCTQEYFFSAESYSDHLTSEHAADVSLLQIMLIEMSSG